MSTIQASIKSSGSEQTTEFSGRIGWLVYAVSTYAVGASALFWFLFAISGLVPAGFGPIQTNSVIGAIVVNLLLVAQFGASHSVMARRGFKQWIQQYIPACAERATFVLVAGLSMAFLVWNWQSIPGTAWHVTNPVAVPILWGLNLFGIGYLLASSFVTNHFELFGLRQAWLNFRRIPYQPLQFKQVWMYRYSRHPMMLGILLTVWCMPEMSITRLVIASLMTAYVFIGVFFEERSLVQEFGDTYREYRKRIGMFFSF